MKMLNKSALPGKLHYRFSCSPYSNDRRLNKFVFEKYHILFLANDFFHLGEILPLESYYFGAASLPFLRRYFPSARLCLSIGTTKIFLALRHFLSAIRVKLGELFLLGFGESHSFVAVMCLMPLWCSLVDRDIRHFRAAVQVQCRCTKRENCRCRKRKAKDFLIHVFHCVIVNRPLNSMKV